MRIAIWLVMAIAVSLAATPASAQQSFYGIPQGSANNTGNCCSVSPTNPASDFLVVTHSTGISSGNSYGLPLGAFASQPDLTTTNSNLAATNAALAGIAAGTAGLGQTNAAVAGTINVLNATNSALASTNAALNATNSALASTNAAVQALGSAIGKNRTLMLQGVAMASAFNIAAPNPGDRFAINVGGAGYFGELAGSASLSYRVAPRVTVYVGVSQSANQSLFKGGMTLSLP